MEGVIYHVRDTIIDTEYFIINYTEYDHSNSFAQRNLSLPVVKINQCIFGCTIPVKQRGK